MIPLTLDEQAKIQKRIENALMFYDKGEIDRKTFINRTMTIISTSDFINLNSPQK